MELSFLMADQRRLQFVERVQPAPVYKYAIVLHDPNRDTGLRFTPDAVHMPDRPMGDNIGHSIPISPAWWSYIRKTNNDAGWSYATTSQAMWINLPGDPREIDIQNEKTNAESIISGGNFVAYDKDTKTHIRLVAFDYRMNPSSLDPLLDNWHFKPWLFWKPVAISRDGQMINPGRDKTTGLGVDVYFPLLKYTELWLPKSSVELFPAGDYDYQLRGTDVYNGAEPLMTVEKDRTRYFWTNWKLETIGVIPPR